jgi:preprotein translocase subunit SecD
MRVLARAASAPFVDAPERGRRHWLALAAAGAAGAVAFSWVGAERLNLMTPVAAQVRFEVRLAEETPVPGLQVARVSGDSRLIYLHPELVVGNDDIAQATVLDEGVAGFVVQVELLGTGAERMRQATANHVGRPVAILLDGSVVMAPTLRSPISSSARITGTFTRRGAERIAAGLLPR